jgi:uncharacterized coiled-coil protein SlyX
MELKEVFDILAQKFNEQTNKIESQENLISALNAQISDLEQQMASDKGRIIELESKWANMQKLLKGVKP